MTTTRLADRVGRWVGNELDSVVAPAADRLLQVKERDHI
jgi:hypothetical protein